MTESEVIIVDNTPIEIYNKIIKDSVMYSLISVPFTINRMSLLNINARIENIAKGKIAEKLFEYYCFENRILADFKSTSTPFYKTDKRDFLFGGYEWDIKNNFIYRDENLLTEFKYTNLPALIPDRNIHDQWSKREKLYFNSSKGVKFLFTFLDAKDKDSGNPFFEVKSSQKQVEFLTKLIEKYSDRNYEKEPFQEDWFWKNMAELKGETSSLKINSYPELVITGYADSDIWDLFKPTNTGKDSNFQDYLKPEWYKKIQKENLQMLSFMNGLLWTRIQNATLPVSKLKPFKF